MHATCEPGSIRMLRQALLATQQHSNFSLMLSTTPLSVRSGVFRAFLSPHGRLLVRLLWLSLQHRPSLSVMRSMIPVMLRSHPISLYTLRCRHDIHVFQAATTPTFDSSILNLASSDSSSTSLFSRHTHTFRDKAPSVPHSLASSCLRRSIPSLRHSTCNKCYVCLTGCRSTTPTYCGLACLISIWTRASTLGCKRFHSTINHFLLPPSFHRRLSEFDVCYRAISLHPSERFPRAKRAHSPLPIRNSLGTMQRDAYCQRHG